MSARYTIPITLLILIAAFIISCSSTDSSLEAQIPDDQAVISGSVVLPDGEDYALVYLSEQPDDAVMTDSAGNFELIVNMHNSRSALEASITNTSNEKLIIVTPSGDRGFTINVEVTKGERAVVTKVNLTSTGSISGQILLDGENDHSGVLVYLNGTNFSTMTDIDGNYSLSNISEGTYMTMTAEKVGFISSHVSDLSIIPAQDTHINVISLDNIACGTSSYYASTGLYPDETSIAWGTYNTTSGNALNLANGILNIETTDPAHYFAFTHSGVELNIPENLVIETRLKIISGNSSSTARGIAGIVVTTEANRGNALYIDKDKVFLLDIGQAPSEIANIDTDDAFHTYRMEINNTSGEINVYYDGEFLLSGMLYNDALMHGATKRIYWGDWAGAAYGKSNWKYFTHNATICSCQQGAAPPVSFYASNGFMPTDTMPSWEFYNTSTSNSSLALSGDTLTIESSNASDYMAFRQKAPMLLMPDILTVEANLIINSGVSYHPARDVAGIIITTEANRGNSLYIGKDMVFLLEGPATQGAFATVDTDDAYHTYQIEINKSTGGISVLYDDEPLLTGSLFVDTYAHGNEERIIWGDWSNVAYGKSSWKYLTHNAGLSSSCAAP